MRIQESKLNLSVETTKKQKIKLGDISFTYWEGQCDPQEFVVFGIDPGVNFGASCIYKSGKVILGYGSLPKTTMRIMHGVHAFELARHFMGQYGPDAVAIEDAAFNSRFGQVGLAEVRMGFFFGSYWYTSNVQLIPPKKARKLAFSDGNVTAFDLLPQINHNAADALGLALALASISE